MRRAIEKRRASSLPFIACVKKCPLLPLLTYPLLYPAYVTTSQLVTIFTLQVSLKDVFNLKSVYKSMSTETKGSFFEVK